MEEHVPPPKFFVKISHFTEKQRTKQKNDRGAEEGSRNSEI